MHGRFPGSRLKVEPLEANVGRFVNKIASMAERTQFIVITHNKRTMEAAKALYGVTMQEAGVSKIVSVKFE